MNQLTSLPLKLPISTLKLEQIRGAVRAPWFLHFKSLGVSPHQRSIITLRHVSWWCQISWTTLKQITLKNPCGLVYHVNVICGPFWSQGLCLNCSLKWDQHVYIFFISTIFIVVGILKRSSGENRLIISFLLLNGV